MKRFPRFLIASLTLAALAGPPAVASDTVRIAIPFGFDNPNPDPAIGWNGWRTSDAGITETLYWLNRDGELEPRLAADARSLSPTTWEIDLKPGVTFHDGSVMDAEAVRFSLERVTDPESPVYNERIASLIGIDSITVVDADTVQIETRTPNAAFLNDLVDPGLSILSAGTTPDAFYGSGPFQLAEIVPSERISMTRFDDYWGGAAAAPAIDLLTVKDPTTVMLALESGDIDIAANFPDSDLPRVSTRDDLEVEAVADGRLMFFFMQVNEGPLADVRVRRALDHLLPREEIVETVLNTAGGAPGAGIFPPQKAWANESITPTAFDRDAALALLAEAGITDTDGDTRLELNGEPFRVVVRSYLGRPSMQPAAELFMAHLEAAGITTELRILRDWTVAVDDFREGRADMLMFSSNAAPTGNAAYFPNFTFRTGALENFGSWSNAEFDGLLQQAIAAFDPEERQAAVNRMQEIIAEELPVLVAFYKNRVAVAHDRVENFSLHPAGIYLVDNALSVAD